MNGTVGGTLGSLLTSATFNPSAGPRSSADVTFSDSAQFRTAVSDALAGDGLLRLSLARSDDSGPGQQRFARFDDETATTADNRPQLLVTHSVPRTVHPDPGRLRPAGADRFRSVGAGDQSESPE